KRHAQSRQSTDAKQACQMLYTVLLVAVVFALRYGEKSEVMVVADGVDSCLGELGKFPGTPGHDNHLFPPADFSHVQSERVAPLQNDPGDLVEVGLQEEVTAVDDQKPALLS